MKIAIVGAGAAGLMCACMLDTKHQVVVFEKNPDAGKKLVITGNKRCNITNLIEPCEFLKSVPQNPQFLSNALNKFTPKDAVDFFGRIGVQTQVEQGGRVFPVSGGSVAVKKAMQDFAVSRGVKFIFDSIIKSVCKQSDGFLVQIVGSDVLHKFDAVIIATGGLSFPGTGSSGDGLKFAASFGHDIVSPRPALCGLKLEKPAGFQGTSVTCAVEIVDKETASSFDAVAERIVGDMLFTKNGVSGPVIYTAVSKFKGQSINRHFLRINFVPRFTNEEFERQFAFLIKENAKNKPFYLVRKFVPQNVANWLVEIANLPRGRTCAQLTSTERDRLLSVITHARISIKDFDAIETATITRGGINVQTIDSKSMESKIVPKLFFIGEVLDIDGLCGGFNLQIAFSTAVACAKAL